MSHRYCETQSTLLTPTGDWRKTLVNNPALLGNGYLKAQFRPTPGAINVGILISRNIFERVPPNYGMYACIHAGAITVHKILTLHSVLGLPLEHVELSST